MLAGIVFQPDDEVGIIGVVVEERYASAACQVAEPVNDFETVTIAIY